MSSTKKITNIEDFQKERGLAKRFETFSMEVVNDEVMSMPGDRAMQPEPAMRILEQPHDPRNRRRRRRRQRGEHRTERQVVVVEAGAPPAPGGHVRAAGRRRADRNG